MDRENRVTYSFDPESLVSFPVFAGFIVSVVVSEGRLYFIGPDGTDREDKGLLRVSVDPDSGLAVLARSREIPSPRNVSFPLVKRHGAVFPRALETKGSP